MFREYDRLLAHTLREPRNLEVWLDWLRLRHRIRLPEELRHPQYVSSLKNVLKKLDGNPGEEFYLLMADIMDIEMVEIPAGEMLYNTRFQGGKDSLGLIEIPRFYVSKTPITHAQYQRWLNVLPKKERNLRGLKNSPYIHFLGHGDRMLPEQEIINRFLEDKQDHPVLWVTKYSASQFAKFLGMSLPTPKQFCRYSYGTTFDVAPVRFVHNLHWRETVYDSPVYHDRKALEWVPETSDGIRYPYTFPEACNLNRTLSILSYHYMSPHIRTSCDFEVEFAFRVAFTP